MFNYQWNFSFLSHYINILLQGIFTTLELSLFTIFFASLLGVLLGILMSLNSKIISSFFIFYVDTIRSIPEIVLILLIYYLFPTLGFQVQAFWPALIALIINNSAFFADIIRGSITGLPKGLTISARSLGMNTTTILRRIILPEVYRETFPSITFLYIAAIKHTSLVSILAVYEITHVGAWIIASTFKPLEVYIVIAVLYLIILLPLTILSRRFEKSNYFMRRSI